MSKCFYDLQTVRYQTNNLYGMKKEAENRPLLPFLLFVHVFDFAE